MQHLLFLFFVDGISPVGELHFAEVDDVVIPEDKHIDLCPIALFVSALVPG